MNKEQADNSGNQEQSVKTSVRNMSKSKVEITNEEGKTKKISANKLFIEILNEVTAQFAESIIKDDLKPKYKFIQSRVTSNNFDDATKNNEKLYENEEYNEAFNKLEKTGYTVEIIEDFENKNSTSGDRYVIRITDRAGVYADINLAKYRDNLLLFDFDEEEFIVQVLKKIDGSLFNELYPLAHLIAECISLTIYDRNKYTLLYRKLGWDRHDKSNKRFFKYDEVITMLTGVKGKIVMNNIESIKKSSNNPIDKVRWILLTLNLMKKHEYDALLFGAGVSGIVRQLLDFTKETNININIQGNSGAGKSMIGHYILSFFGNPVMLEGTANDTENAMEEIRSKRNVLPYVLDERMLRMTGESENKKKISVLLDIFREYEGKVKERLGKQYEDYTGERTYGPIISSSVEEMMNYVKDFNDLGQFRRFIELNIGSASDERLFNEDEAQIADTFASKYYGFGVRIIAEYLVEKMYNDDNYIIKRFNELDEEYSKRLYKNQKNLGLIGLDSSSKRFALIVLSYQIVEEALLYGIFDVIMMIKEYKEANKEYKVSVEDITKRLALDWEKELFNKFSDSYDTSGDKLDDFIKMNKNDMSERIYDILEDNILNKMKQVYELQKTNFSYLDFYIKNTDAFFKEEMNNKDWDGDPDKYIGRIKKDNDKITLIFKASLAVHRLLLGHKDIDLATIKDYIKKYYKIRGNKEQINELQKDFELANNEVFKNYCQTTDGIELETKQKNYCFETDKKEASTLIYIKIPENCIVKEDKE